MERIARVLVRNAATGGHGIWLMNGTAERLHSAPQHNCFLAADRL